MKIAKDVRSISPGPRFLLLALTGLLVAVMGQFLPGVTGGYFEAVQEHGWSVASIAVGLYLGILWAGTTFFGLFVAICLKITQEELFGK